VTTAAEAFVDHGRIYLLSHSIGLPIRGAREAIEQCLDVWENDTSGAWPRWLEIIDGFRRSLAELLNAEPASICPQSNVSSGLTKVLGAIRHTFPAGTPTILMTEDAFPSLGYVCQHADVDVRYISRTERSTDPAVWRRHLDGVDIALITHVHSNTGELIPAPEIISIARDLGIVTIVDVAQSVGIIPIDIEQWDAHFLVGSCVKWLSGGPGAGWLWADPQMIDRCEPVDVGWFSHEDPFEFDIHRFRYADDALRFWGGSPTVLPFAAAGHSIEAIVRIGVADIRRHNIELGDRLIDRLGARVTSPHAVSERSGTCIVAAEAGIVDRLASAGIDVDHRLGGIRLSPHVFTTQADLDEAIGHLVD
jgi:selenocysteine lyase/cysteine desulfurase